MEKFMHSIAFIVATKDRPEELFRMLKSIENQNYKPDQIIVVDGGDDLVDDVVNEFKALNSVYLRCTPPSATRQRNMGIQAVREDVSLIGILDDDITLESDALEKMMQFWDEVPDNVGGASFNMINHPPLLASFLKHSSIARKIGLYSNQNGIVLPSGFHTLIGYVPDSIFVQWLPTTAVIYRKKIFDKYQFDEWFKGYSYLEDLDFSYRVGKEYQLAVVADAGYCHYPAPGGRGSGYEFGVREVLNRIYFVKKHKELSLLKCLVALKIRLFISLYLFLKERKFYFLSRALGNAIGLMKAIFTN